MISELFDLLKSVGSVAGFGILVTVHVTPRHQATSTSPID
ncbi:hypothetical protein BF49_2906 [Bradyrhizobium sp.]|nr:hypothetical protein BF49_2906 [Bradyrhizobium sp.]